jgi:NAD+ synthase (glutamine-hydrolysing)
MKIAVAQINSTVGDLAGNERLILNAYRKGEQLGVDLVLVPELAITGYPPRDLLLKKDFISKNLACLNRLAAVTGEVGLVVGYVDENHDLPGRALRNSAALLASGKIVAKRHKTLLPTYDVFDEDRYFEPAKGNDVILFRGVNLGLTICEDVWNDEDFWPEPRYRANPPVDLLSRGAGILLNISASPWHLGKNKTRREMIASLAKKSRVPVIYCNSIGGNDELIFDGDSLAFNGAGESIGRGAIFREDFFVADTEGPVVQDENGTSDDEILYRGLVVGVRDYLHKCGFRSAVLGLSGGIDSALVACLAREALGAENVRGISLPSQYSSQGSLDDARDLAKKLGIAYDVIPIQPMFAAAKEQLREVFTGRAEDTTEENLQARIRGVLLMALSNKFGSLLLTTGNKSELAVGYCTLYGDMCGGLAVISDVPKTVVYRLARWINRHGEIIPESSITKPPSAELRPNQTDQDSLPPYEILDAILEEYVVRGRSMGEIVVMGFPEEAVKKVIRLIDLNEYKRRQAAPGLKVTTKAFGVGRRFPIAQRYREA